ncbi:MAG: hypothetical protein EZS28_001069 [Streblomastix strix]|uniref:Uncharacterized protein n=1 Tax=Streblomastix strix TaxID=222440 RepID=A0A5J4X8A3_9EUKA|nr:MAG: hypothetical protein EZS28_001069 [Streblomastix strix]
MVVFHYTKTSSESELIICMQMFDIYTQGTNQPRESLDSIIKIDKYGDRTIYYISKPKTTQYEDLMLQNPIQSAQKAPKTFLTNTIHKDNVPQKINAQPKELATDFASRRLPQPLNKGEQYGR